MTHTTDTPVVELEREIDASPETVWNILTTPELFSTWLEGVVLFEARVGAPFRAEFAQFGIVLSGELVSLDPDARHLALTWGVEEGDHTETFPAGSSLVEFRVREEGDGCVMAVRHTRLPSARAAEENEQGWRFHLSRMAVYANRTDLEAGLSTTLPAWFAAWNEQDESRRMRHLESCCAEDIEFRDDWASAEGRTLLGQHISNCFRFMPGWRLEPTGDVRVCRGEVLFGWRGIGPGGVATEGHNHATASYRGALRRVTGFQTSMRD